MAWIGAVIYKTENGEIHFLVQDSESTLQKYAGRGVQTKFPGGSNDDHPEERSTLQTLTREIEEETWLRLKDGVEPPIIFGPIPGEKHPRMFYLIESDLLEGDLRDEEIKDGDDILYPPRWVKADDLERDKRLLYETHQGVPFAALHFLGRHLSLVD